MGATATLERLPANAGYHAASSDDGHGFTPDWFSVGLEQLSIIDSLATAIDLFRLPDGTPYRELLGSARVMPSVESQVQHAAQHLREWIRGVVVDVVEAVDVEANEHLNSTDQLDDLVNRSIVTRGHYNYWETNYQRDNNNPAGRFVAWMTRRAVLPIVRREKHEIVARHQATYGNDSLLNPDFSGIATMRELRRAASQARMGAKINLTCMRVITPECIDRLGIHLSRNPNDNPQTTVNPMDALKLAEEAVAALQQDWSKAAISKAELPF